MMARGDAWYPFSCLPGYGVTSSAAGVMFIPPAGELSDYRTILSLEPCVTRLRADLPLWGIRLLYRIRHSPRVPARLPNWRGIATLRAMNANAPKDIRSPKTGIERRFVSVRVVPNHTRWLSALLALVSLTPVVGCATGLRGGAGNRSLGAWWSEKWTSGWSTDYESAERRARKTNAPLALCFTDSKFAAEDESLLALRDEKVESRLSGYVHATLVKSHEPDRRYAEQFGITRAPSLILVHRDGTFHTYTGAITPDALVTFIDESVPPGAVAVRNPLIPRNCECDWLTDLGAATAKSRETQTPMLVAYERRLTGDWGRLSRILATREVGIRVVDLVHCRVRLLPNTGAAFITPFGALRLPALVVVQPDGSYHTIETPSSSEEVARDLDRYLRPRSAKSEPISAISANTSG